MAEKSSRILLPAILAILAYEWLISGFNKILSGTFVVHMHQEMIVSIPNMQYQFYAHLLQKYCLPHCEIVAIAIEAGEIAVGISFGLLSYFIFSGRLNVNIMKLGVITGLVSAFMTLNFFFYQGGSFFVNTSDPFDEGIPIDLMMVLIQLAVACFFWAASKPMKKQTRLSH